MLEFVNFFNWNTEIIFFYIFLSVAIWAVCLSSELRDKVKHPKLLGSAASLISGFELGLFAVLPLVMFLLISWALEYYVTKYGLVKVRDK